MSVPNMKLRYRSEWNSVCHSYGDIEYQKRCWFREEGPEVGSIGEDFDHMLIIFHDSSETDRGTPFNDECNHLIKELMEKVSYYMSAPETIYSRADEDELLSDPKWIEIIELAQRAGAAVEQFEKEMKRGVR